VSVCLSVCVSVCPAIRFHSSQRIFSKCSGNLLRVMTRSVGYIIFFSQSARVCVHSLIFERIKSKFAGNILRLTICSRGTPSVSREIRSRLTGVPTPKQPLVTPTRVSMIRKQHRRSGFSDSACNKIARRNRPSTLSIYQTRWAAFVKWCKVKKLDPVKTPTHIIADFLVDLFDKTFSVGSIRGYRSAISTTFRYFGRDIGGDTNISDLLSGMAIERP
jgi:hypothetical protein